MNLFKECMSEFPTGVTVVTIRERYGITINSFCSLSLNPMLVLFNLEKAANKFYMFHECKEFVVNILSEEQEEVSRAFAENMDMQLKKYFSNENSLPIIQGALCYIHCFKHAIYAGGDHAIIIGEVHKMEKMIDEKPLVYYKSKYCTLR